MKQINTFNLSLLVGKFLVSCSQRNELTELPPSILSDNDLKKLITKPIVMKNQFFISSGIIFNEFQF